MKRREFITLLGGATMAWPVAARAQQGERMRRIGVLMPLAENDPEVRSSIDALRRGLLELGWREEHNLKIEYRFVAEPSALKSAAAELVALAPDVIICRATPATAALKAATAKIPIVFTVVVDPVSSELVQSWARPGGNITLQISNLRWWESGWRCSRKQHQELPVLRFCSIRVQHRPAARPFSNLLRPPLSGFD